MTLETKGALATAAAAIALGIAGDALFQGQALGVDVPVWIALFVVALAVILRVTHAPLHQGRRWMVAPLLLFGGLFAWHDSPLLLGANLLAIAAIVALGALRRPVGRVVGTGVSDYAGGFVAAICGAAGGPIPLLERDIRWSELGRAIRSRPVVSAARGAAITVPLVLVFGGLFVAADAVFKGYVTGVLPDPDEAATRTGLVIAWTWLSVGLLRDLAAAREQHRVVSAAAVAEAPPRVSLGPVEVGVALALLDTLFLAFVLVQLRYLFGGAVLVEARTHLTYAEYARHGFFELVAVSALALPVLLVADWTLRRGNPRGERVVRTLAVVLIGLLFVVMASALQRMRLYEHQYGPTELRLYATGVIVWLGAVFVWFAATVLRGRRHLFAVGALVSGLAATLALNVLDPDALIARTNLSRPKVDVAYLAGLSDDAVPTLVARVGSLPPPLRAELERRLLERHPASGWRSWTISRSRAAAALDRLR
jgi:hypothetical protein